MKIFSCSRGLRCSSGNFAAPVFRSSSSRKEKKSTCYGAVPVTSCVFSSSSTPSYSNGRGSSVPMPPVEVEISCESSSYRASSSGARRSRSGVPSSSGSFFRDTNLGEKNSLLCTGESSVSSAKQYPMLCLPRASLFLCRALTTRYSYSHRYLKEDYSRSCTSQHCSRRTSLASRASSKRSRSSS